MLKLKIFDLKRYQRGTHLRVGFFLNANIYYQIHKFKPFRVS